jgi:hypothetical protein
MDEVVITFYCAVDDSDAVLAALRANTNEPVHFNREAVRGHDFSDALTAEQVTGNLQRAAVSVTVARAQTDVLIAAVAAARRTRAVRWETVSLAGRGRFE